MATSRSALEYLERSGLQALVLPRPRLSLGGLLVTKVPVPALDQRALLDYEGLDGGAVPDRGAARPWPNQ